MMNAELHIHRFQARHRVSDAAGAKLAQDAQSRLLDGELEAALARLGGRDKLVLVRRLSARVRISSRRSDRDNARAWSDALALSLEHTLRHGGEPDLLRFASPQHALRAFAADALHSCEIRDWAWQRLGLLPVRREAVHSSGQRRQSLLRLIADDAEQGVALLRSLFFSRLWPTLLAQLHEGELRGLALAVLVRLTGSSGAAFADASQTAGAPVSTATADAATSAAPVSVPESRPAPAWLAATRRAAPGAARERWALRLAAMLAAPDLARRGPAAVDAQLRAWLDESEAADAVTGALRVLESAVAAPQRTQTVSPPGTSPERARPGSSADGANAPRPHHSEAEFEADATAEEGAPAAQAAAGDAAAADDTSGHTRLGGLLYLPPLLPLCGALALLEETALWPSLPQALHQLALRLWPLATDDPAALAFCGLAPRRPPPAMDDLDPGKAPAREDALHRAQDLLLHHLAQRLPDWRGAALLQRVLCRDARISADPGWIDVVYPMRDVSTELRRAAIDLDPGFLPWLGVVLRYRYE